jgi:CheY-like chemotaxis protein
LRVLVVDDDPDSLEFAAFVLTEAGGEVVAVSTPGEVLAVLERERFDVLVSDVGMAELDGYGLVREIRRGSGIPAIALTAFAGEVNRQAAMDAGFQAHLAKPIDPEELVSTVVLVCAGDGLEVR